MDDEFIVFLILIFLYAFCSDDSESTRKIGDIGKVEKENAIIL